MEKHKQFAWRAMTSVVVASSFIALIASGVVMFVSPPGRVANWSDWRLLALTKHDWTGLHVWFGALFLIAAIVHLFFNWRPMLGYFKDRMTRRVGFRWEWVAGMVLVALVFAGTRFAVPPFSTLLTFEERVKNGWENPQERAPIPHAELLTLKELAEKADVPLAAALERLNAQKLRLVSAEIVVADLASENEISALRVYEMIQPVSKPAAGGEPGAGGGVGWKTLEQFCAEEGIAINTALTRLEARKVKATAQQTMREIAVNNGFSRPPEILGIVRGE